MTAWKQILISFAILVAAAFAWVQFFPGAPEILNRWGIEWAQASTPKIETGSIGTSKAAGKDRPTGPKATVVTARATLATINDRLKTIGSGRANATVAVTPYGSGRLEKLLVQSGAHIESGQVIATLDSDTETIALERAKAARDDSAAKVERIRSLRSSNAATQVQLTDAELAQRNDELSVHDAQVAFDRRSITSPIAGVVGILPIEAGNYVTSQSTIATVDDRSSILVDFWVPERFAAAVKIGAAIEATPLANPNTTFKGAVSAIDNRIDEKSRTLWVQATIANPADSLRAGMSFEVTMQFPGDTYPAVSPLAIQWGTDGSFIWTVEAGNAKRVPVRIIQRNTENVLVDAPIERNALIITEGVQNVRDGSDVDIASDAGEPVANASGS